jgi:integrase
MSAHETPTASGQTLQHVLERLNTNGALSDTRRRDLKSAVVCYAALSGSSPAAVALDLAGIRAALDVMVPIQAKVSRKRWANLRSDLAAAISASGLRQMVKASGSEMSDSWSMLFAKARAPYLQHGLSRFARWASERQIGPCDVTDAALDCFIADLECGSLVRKIRELRPTVVRSWNALRKIVSQEGLLPLEVRRRPIGPPRFPWDQLPKSFRVDVERYLEWASMPDPLDDAARTRALAPRTVKLQKDHIHSAVTAAMGAGINSDAIGKLEQLVSLDIFKRVLRQRWESEGRKLSAYTHGVAGTLIAVATEWVKASSENLLALKAIRRKLGSIKSGLTDKNKSALRKFDDKRSLSLLLKLPGNIWRQTTRDLKVSRRGFIDLQSGLAIQILLVAPLRMKNLASLEFEKHVQWPHGYNEPAWLIIDAEETKNKIPLEFELPEQLSERLAKYRNEITPAITGSRPNKVFVTWNGRARTQATIALAIEKTVMKYVGVRLTPHQFRHLAAKIMLDETPGAFVLVQQLMGHKDIQTTTNYYAGIDTRRAGRAQAALIAKLQNDF